MQIDAAASSLLKSGNTIAWITNTVLLAISIHRIEETTERYICKTIFWKWALFWQTVFSIVDTEMKVW